jgi:hypothetical protein
MSRPCGSNQRAQTSVPSLTATAVPPKACSVSHAHRNAGTLALGVGVALAELLERAAGVRLRLYAEQVACIARAANRNPYAPTLNELMQRDAQLVA